MGKDNSSIVTTHGRCMSQCAGVQILVVRSLVFFSLIATSHEQTIKNSKPLKYLKKIENISKSSKKTVKMKKLGQQTSKARTTKTNY